MTSALQPDTPLTPRERDVACLIARGLPYKLVADRLGIAPGTLTRHVDNMAWKFGHDRPQLDRVLVTHYCLLQGWVGIDEIELC